MNDWREVTTAVIGGWPGQQFDRERMAAYVHELQARDLSADEALAAVREYRGQFPPSAATVAGMVDVHRQGPPPTWRAAYAQIASRITMLPYHDPESGWDAFIETLAGEHESIARFAVQLGVRGVREMPDPNRTQDTAGSVELTRLEREWRETADAWRADPTRGVALEEARRRQIGGSFAEAVGRLRPAGELNPGEEAA